MSVGPVSRDHECEPTSPQNIPKGTRGKTSPALLFKVPPHRLTGGSWPQNMTSICLINLSSLYTPIVDTLQALIVLHTIIYSLFFNLILFCLFLRCFFFFFPFWEYSAIAKGFSENGSFVWSSFAIYCNIVLFLQPRQVQKRLLNNMSIIMLCFCLEFESKVLKLQDLWGIFGMIQKCLPVNEKLFLFCMSYLLLFIYSCTHPFLPSELYLSVLPSLFIPPPFSVNQGA